MVKAKRGIKFTSIIIVIYLENSVFTSITSWNKKTRSTSHCVRRHTSTHARGRTAPSVRRRTSRYGDAGHCRC